MAFLTCGRVLPATLDEVHCLWAFDLVDHFSLHACVCHKRCADSGADHENLVELDLFASCGVQFFDTEYVARGHFVLLAAGFENRKHMVFLHFSRL